ncbi:type III-A CRISPR-associated RAMP protein Csm5, partial [Vibrio vulnificus]
FPDMPTLYKRMCELGLQEDFEEYLMGKGKRDLRAFFDQHQIKETDFGGYRIKETKYETEVKGKLNNIVTFIKDAYGNPYIPGSSLKGAIRTILVNRHFHTDNVKW